MKLFILLSFLFLSINSNAIIFKKTEKKLSIKKDIPMELKLLNESLHLLPLTDEQFTKYLNKMSAIDYFASIITKEEFYSIVKSEIYKTILKNLPPINKINVNIDKNELKKASKNAKIPFVKWLILSFYEDADQLVSSKNYKNYIAQSQSGDQLTSESKKVGKKLSIIARFMNRVSIEDPDTLNSELLSTYEECIQNIEQSMFILVGQSKFEKIEVPENINEKMNFFAIEDEQKIEINNIPNAPKSVEDIIDGSSNSTTLESSLPKPSSENWQIDDSVPETMKNLPKPSNDADWLQDF